MSSYLYDLNGVNADLLHCTDTWIWISTNYIFLGISCAFDLFYRIFKCIINICCIKLWLLFEIKSNKSMSCELSSCWKEVCMRFIGEGNLWLLFILMSSMWLLLAGTLSLFFSDAIEEYKVECVCSIVRLYLS